jgi:pSer/pThr/pTyr-binding forkhead associated (FHA) protein
MCRTNVNGLNNIGLFLISMGSKTTAEIGYSSTSHIRLESGSISRFHAVIQKIGGSFLLQDVNSIHGTHILTSKPVRIPSNKPLQVLIGKSKLAFSLPTRPHLLYLLSYNFT